MEGYYIGIVGEHLPSLVDARLLRVQVLEVSDTGDVLARIGRALHGKLKRGESILLVRPSRTTTAQMMLIPDLTTIVEVPAADEQSNEVQPVRMTRSIVNLKNITRALSEFHDSFKQFPPAALVGPDGKAWHSWRVLLLPFLDQEALYFKYRFDEPWDGPNNRKLLDSMPHVYTDQPPGKLTDHFTRYAAVTGKGMAFTAEGFRFDGKRMRLGRGAGTARRRVIDGTANTLAVGTVSLEEEIPWTKPEDIVIDENGSAAGFGKKGRFAAPYNSGNGNFALFGRLDGGVMAIRDSIDDEVFRSTLTTAGRERQSWSKIEEAFFPQPVALIQDGPVIYLFNEGGQPKARLVR